MCIVLYSVVKSMCYISFKCSTVQYYQFYIHSMQSRTAILLLLPQEMLCSCRHQAFVVATLFMDWICHYNDAVVSMHV